MKPLGPPLAPQNHSVTDQGCEAVDWVGWERGVGGQARLLSSFADLGF